MGGVNGVAGPEEGEDLAIAILEQPNGAHHALANLDALPQALILPEQRPAAWHTGDNFAAPLLVNSISTRNRTGKRQHGGYVHGRSARHSLADDAAQARP